MIDNFNASDLEKYINYSLGIEEVVEKEKIEKIIKVQSNVMRILQKNELKNKEEDFKVIDIPHGVIPERKKTKVK